MSSATAVAKPPQPLQQPLDPWTFEEAANYTRRNFNGIEDIILVANDAPCPHDDRSASLVSTHIHVVEPVESTGALLQYRFRTAPIIELRCPSPFTLTLAWEGRTASARSRVESGLSRIGAAAIRSLMDAVVPEWTGRPRGHATANIFHRYPCCVDPDKSIRLGLYTGGLPGFTAELEREEAQPVSALTENVLIWHPAEWLACLQYMW